MLTPFRGFWVSKVRVQRKVRWRKSTTPLLCLWIICSNISHNVKSTFSKSTSLSGSKLNPKLQYFPNVLLHPTLSVSIFFFFLKPWMRTTAFVNLYFIELRHPESICTVVLYFTVLLPPWHGSFTQLTKKKPSSFNVANLNSINTMSTATAQKCPTQNIPLTDISMCMCVCVLGVGGWVWCPGKCEFS